MFPVKLIIPIITIAFISGCTSTPGGTGVIIENFDPDFTNPFMGEQINFQVRLRNTGSVDSPAGKVVILGLDEWIGGGGIPFIGGGSCGYADKLLAANPAFGTTGEILVCDPFTYTAPDVPQGLPVTYNPTARLSYTYGSNIVKTLTVAPQQELRRIENLGSSLPAETKSASSSPIAIDIITKGPIRLFGQTVKFPIEITLTNVGGGVVCNGNYNACDTNTNWNKITISAKMGSTPITGCDSKEVTLFKGQSNTITCQATITDTLTTGFVQKTITVESEYGYFVDRTASVTVNWASP